VSRARGTAGGAKKRFGYLAAATDPEANEPRTTDTPTEERPSEEQGTAHRQAGGTTPTEEPDGGGGEAKGRVPRRSRARRKPAAEELKSVPKGEGRMKQERSQLNVRVPTALKRRASAKAVLEGKDIGEVVERLLREYLDG